MVRTLYCFETNHTVRQKVTTPFFEKKSHDKVLKGYNSIPFQKIKNHKVRQKVRTVLKQKRKRMVMKKVRTWFFWNKKT